jgi:hypothetical protein
MERIPFFQMLRSIIGCCRQFANDVQKETGDRLNGNFWPAADQPEHRSAKTMGLVDIWPLKFVPTQNLLLTEASEIFFFAKKIKIIHFWMGTSYITI